MQNRIYGRLTKKNLGGLTSQFQRNLFSWYFLKKDKKFEIIWMTLGKIQNIDFESLNWAKWESKELLKKSKTRSQSSEFQIFKSAKRQSLGFFSL